MLHCSYTHWVYRPSLVGRCCQCSKKFAVWSVFYCLPGNSLEVYTYEHIHDSMDIHDSIDIHDSMDIHNSMAMPGGE